MVQVLRDVGVTDARLGCPCWYTLSLQQALNASRMITKEGEEHATNPTRAALVWTRHARCHDCIRSHLLRSPWFPADEITWGPVCINAVSASTQNCSAYVPEAGWCVAITGCAPGTSTRGARYDSSQN